MVTQADGSQVAQSLTQLGITEIRLTDGLMINGRSTFMMNGVTGTVVSAVLMAETQGYRAVEAMSLALVDLGLWLASEFHLCNYCAPRSKQIHFGREVLICTH
jgi:hypothetical protein